IASADGTTVFLPGQTYKFKVTIANSTYPYSGIDISSYNIAEDSLITGSGLRWDRYYRELTHSSPKSLGSSHAATWTFSFRTSKTPGADTLYAVGNATSGGGNGQWSFAKPMVIDTRQSGVESSNALASNGLSVLENPCRTTLRFKLQGN